ncbi:hypothetical protein C8R43DRAFT_1138116 [Mycena crocata]|nr:hypothetical protein C8R43DRAFT_1138116 [Mycena crocata]
MTMAEPLPQFSLDDLLHDSLFAEPGSYDMSLDASSPAPQSADFDTIFKALGAMSMNPPPRTGVPVDGCLALQDVIRDDIPVYHHQDTWDLLESSDTPEFTCMDPAEFYLDATPSRDTTPVADIESPVCEDSPTPTDDDGDDVTLSDVDIPETPSSDKWLRRSTRCTARLSASPDASAPAPIPKKVNVARPSTVQTPAPSSEKPNRSRGKKARVSARPAPSRTAAVPSAFAVKAVPDHYLHLLELGCKVVGKGMVCPVPHCRRITGNFADQERHQVVHFPELRVSCRGCPGTFSRGDALKRHMGKKGGCSHTSPARRAFLGKFQDLATVARLKAECPTEDDEATKKLNLKLMAMFEDLFSSKR